MQFVIIYTYLNLTLELATLQSRMHRWWHQSFAWLSKEQIVNCCWKTWNLAIIKSCQFKLYSMKSHWRYFQNPAHVFASPQNVIGPSIVFQPVLYSIIVRTCKTIYSEIVSKSISVDIMLCLLNCSWAINETDKLLDGRNEANGLFIGIVSQY